MSDDADRDGRSAMARGYVLASRAMSIGLQMVIPVGLGWWADSSWKTAPWLMVVGVVLGFTSALLQLIQLAKESASEEDGPPSAGTQAVDEKRGGGS